MVELQAGVRRVTFALPLGIDHVHCYLLPTDGGWTAVDAGLGLPDARERWRRALEAVDGSVARIVITHLHPDHVGAAADLAELTGATVFQGADDYEQCVRAWGEGRLPERMPEYFRAHGMPDEHVARLRDESAALAGLVRFVRDPELLSAGEEVAGWTVLHLPGHADGHIALLRDGVLIAGDALLATITPNVGLYPDSRPDPLADYLSSLSRVAELAPHVAYGGHGDPIADPAGRADELVAHHRKRLEETMAALDGRPRNAYDVSLTLFPEPLSPGLRRFAVAETRAHLEYLVHRGEARRQEDEARLTYSS